MLKMCLFYKLPREEDEIISVISQPIDALVGLTQSSYSVNVTCKAVVIVLLACFNLYCVY